MTAKLSTKILSPFLWPPERMEWLCVFIGIDAEIRKGEAKIHLCYKICRTGYKSPIVSSERAAASIRSLPRRDINFNPRCSV